MKKNILISTILFLLCTAGFSFVMLNKKVLGGIYNPSSSSQNTIYTTVCSSGCDYTTDGTADDVQIQAALNTGTKVLVKAGTYDITASIVMGDFYYLQGVGVNTILKLASGTNADVVKNSLPNGINTNIVINDLKIDGNGSNQTSPVSGIFLDETTDCLIENVIITDTRGHGIYLLGESEAVKNSQRNTIKNCEISSVVDSSRNAISTLYVQDNIIDKVFAHNNARDGILLNRSDYNSVINCKTYLNANVGVNLYIADNNFISGNFSHDNTKQGISILAGSDYNTISNNVISNNASYGILGGAASTQNKYNIYVGNQVHNSGDDGLVIFYSDYARVENNIITGNADQGLPIDNSVGVSVIGNYVATNTNEGIEIKNSSNNAVISGNTIIGNSQGTAGADSGIRIETGILNTVVTGNRVYDNQTVKTQKYGFEMQGTADYATVIGNNFSGNLTADTVIVGSNNDILGNGTSTANILLGEFTNTGISGDGTGKAVCIKTDGNLGTCADAVGVGGTCTCN